jgi:hypothetical protein
MKIEINVIGKLYTRPEIDADLNITKPATELAGWHVNTTHPVDGWAKFKVQPSSPRVVFSGVETHFYTFADEEEYEALSEDAVLEYEPVQNVTEISIVQCCKMLARWGVDDAQIEESISQMPDGLEKTDALIEWRRASKVLISNALVGYIATLLGKSDELQTAFNEAAKL